MQEKCDAGDGAIVDFLVTPANDNSFRTIRSSSHIGSEDCMYETFQRWLVTKFKFLLNEARVE